MVKKLFFLLSFVLISSFPIYSEAKNLSALKGIHLASYDEINHLCYQPEGYDPVSGCYFPQDGITIRNDLPIERFKWVFWHEIGHFFLYDVSDDELKIIFNPTPQKLSATIISEIAADTFALWMIGGKVPDRQRDLFIRLLTN